MSALYLNKVMLCGRLTADVELKTTAQSGQSVTTFTLAVNRPKAKDAAEQNADFIRCVAWEKRAEFIARYFKKGDSLFVCGEIRKRKYIDREGRSTSVTEIVVDEAKFVDSKSTTDAQPAPAYGSAAPQFETIDPDADLPF